MREEDTRVADRGDFLAAAILGGILLAAGLLVLVFLGAAAFSADSALGIPGLALLSAFSGATWLLPLWFFAGAYIALDRGRRLALIVALGASALPFLLLAALARFLGAAAQGSFLISATSPPARFGIAIVLGLLIVASSVLVAWLARHLGEREGRIAEAGSRPGLAPMEEDETPGPVEDEALVAGRRVDR
ncbi:MAG: hypothetical protein WCL50_13395, partial [Spirochaetota bacterium]